MQDMQLSNGLRNFQNALSDVYAPVQLESVIDDDRILNNHLHFPFSREKYIYGGYFYNWLVFTHGPEKAHQFFKFHTKHYLNPLRISESFKSYFNEDISEVLYDSMRSHRIKAASQVKNRKGKILAKSLVSNPMNRNEDGIFFLVNEESTHEGEIVVLAKDGTLSKKKTNMKYDK